MKGDFKTNKNTRILMLYNDLINGKEINKISYSMEHNINERTFERDIAEIRNYLSEIFSNQELIYDKFQNVYYLTGNRAKYIDKTDAFIFAKVLLDSHVLRKDELSGLLEKLVTVVNPYERNEFISYFKQGLIMYDSKIKTPILKMLIDFFMVLKKGNDIEITFHDGKVEQLAPIRIVIENSNIKLLANIDSLSNKYTKINIEDISSFKILNTFNAKKSQQNYFKEREDQ